MSGAPEEDLFPERVSIEFETIHLEDLDSELWGQWQELPRCERESIDSAARDIVSGLAVNVVEHLICATYWSRRYGYEHGVWDTREKWGLG